MIEIVLPISQLSSAMAAGALLVGLIVILPLLLSLPVERYPEINAFVLNRMDKLMPACTGIAILSGGFIAAATESRVAQVMFGAGALMLAGVFAVSLIKIAPINVLVQRIDIRNPRPDWQQLRQRWRNWHYVRVGCGQVGALLYCLAPAAAG
ncbi:DUF1772 domain-containing protein [Streptomonospora sp. PA3]|uniref:DUF1772 domain-containing protein n=1 Tax=Streptomonospora sp. PA3 TaxID=2607326 RepID=UPI0012DD95CA|nr:DUF1772 domain-containing protein [Streptomonospora sp. PA3]MUL41474.1 DUF1772 domain-containing protein [Streptomonospora sp. PA3]